VTVTRRNILDDADGRNAFLGGCVQLGQLDAGLTAAQVDQQIGPQVPGWRMRGDSSVQLCWWDLFVLWHYVTMQLATPGTGSNRAHGGPVFLPWHRMFLIRLEEVLQQVSGDPDLALPYWNWAGDGQLPPSQQYRTVLWSDTHLGPARGVVDAGPLAGLRVRLTQRWSPQTGQFLEAHAPRPVERAAGTDTRVRTLPTRARVSACLAESAYDSSAWDTNATGFRNHVEGWTPRPPGLHNRVHVWVGGDMSPGTSPNDPVFYLNHCNVDRIWEAKLRGSGLPYLPTATTPGAPAGQRLDDPMVALIGAALRPQDVLDPSEWYEYDSLAVAD
jgi:tyrosinase